MIDLNYWCNERLLVSDLHYRLTNAGSFCFRFRNVLHLQIFWHPFRSIFNVYNFLIRWTIFARIIYDFFCICLYDVFCLIFNGIFVLLYQASHSWSFAIFLKERTLLCFIYFQEIDMVLIIVFWSSFQSFEYVDIVGTIKNYHSTDRAQPLTPAIHRATRMH